MENPIDELFRSRLENSEFQSGQNLWDRLEEEMVRRRKQQLRIYSSAALILILMVSGFWLLLKPSASVTQQVAQPIRKIIKEPFKQELRDNSAEKVTVVNPGPANKINRTVASLAVQVEDLHFENEVVNGTEMENESQGSVAVAASQELPVSGINSDFADNPEVVVYELVPFEGTTVSSTHQSGFIRTIIEFKREGISIGPIRELKNDLINRIFRSRHRNEISNSTNQITEQ